MASPADTLPDRPSGASEDQTTLPSAQPVYAGRYRIELELGRGGMGRVLRARDLRIGREVAIKVLVRGAHDEQHRLRFELEARAAGALNHPNIVAVHDIAEHEGEPFIVTELLEGETLRKVLARGPLVPSEARELAGQLAEALAAAHARGIVHRDIKPENLFLTEEGRLKVLDFGIAKLMEKPDGVHTETGAVLGTPGYMAPEQIRGQPADARSDVFAFGAVLHEMLSRSGPFARASTVETEYAILHDPPRSLPAGTPRALAAIIERALEKDPAARQPDGGALLRELRGAPGRRRFHLRLPRRLLWFIPPLLLLAVTVAIDRLYLRRASHIDSLAVLPLENRSGDAQQDYLADGVTTALIDELARIRSLRVTSRTSTMAYKGARKPLPQIARELGVDAILEGSVSSAAGRIRLNVRLIRATDESTLWSRNYDGPLRDAATLQSDVASEVTRELNAALTSEESQRLAQKRQIDPAAYDFFLRARYESEAHQNCVGFERTGALLERAIAKDPQFTDAHAMLAGVWARSSWMACSDPKVAEPKARAALHRALELDPESLNARSVEGAIALIFDGDVDRALAEARRAVELAPASADALGTLFDRLIMAGRFDEGIAVAARIAEVDPATATPLSMGLGWALYAAGRFDEAITAERRALEVDPKSYYGHLWIAFASFELGRTKEGSEEVDKAIPLIKPGESCLDDATGATALALAGKRKEALALLVPWEERAKKEYVDAYQLAMVRAQLGDKDAAVRWLEHAWKQRSPSFLVFVKNPIDLQRKAGFSTLAGDARVTELMKRPRAP